MRNWMQVNAGGGGGGGGLNLKKKDPPPPPPPPPPAGLKFNRKGPYLTRSCSALTTNRRFLAIYINQNPLSVQIARTQLIESTL